MKPEDINALVRKLLPSAIDLYIHQYNGTISLGFRTLDDFVTASIAASSANIHAEVFNTFESKLVLPRSIALCRIKLSLAHDLSDERLVWFFAELALLRRSDGSLLENDFSALSTWLRTHANPGQSEAGA